LEYSNYDLIKMESLIIMKYITLLKLFLFLHPFKMKVHLFEESCICSAFSFWVILYM